MKMCRCGATQKAAGKQRCIECWLAAQPADVREKAADLRLAMVPLVLRRPRVPKEEWPVGRRWCASCQTFVRLADCNSGASQCSTCSGRKAHAAMISRTYTIHGRPFTSDDYDQLLRDQGGKCYICLRPSRSKRLAVDHDHVTNEVRGLLCPGEWGCNLGILGRIKDLAMARRVVAYLEDPPANRLP